MVSRYAEEIYNLPHISENANLLEHMGAVYNGIGIIARCATHKETLIMHIDGYEAVYDNGNITINPIEIIVNAYNLLREIYPSIKYSATGRC